MWGKALENRSLVGRKRIDPTKAAKWDFDGVDLYNSSLGLEGFVFWDSEIESIFPVISAII